MYRKCQCNIPKGSEYCRFFNYCYFFYYYYYYCYCSVVVIVVVVVFLLLKALQSWEEEEGGVCVCVRGEQWLTRDSNWLEQGHEWSEMNSIGKLTSWAYSPLPQLGFS